MLRLLIPSVLLLSSVTHAATWATYAQDQEGVVYAYEQTQITHHDDHGLVLVVWTRRQTARLMTTVARREVHCPSSSTRTVYQVTGDAREVTYEMRDDAARWQWAMPDTPEMILTRHVCTHYK